MSKLYFFENEYSVSEDGVITSHQGRVLNQQVCRKGYHRVVVQSGRSQRKHMGVHRLVAKAYLPNPTNLPEVNHLDGDKSNNHVANLEWCTTKQNIRHAIDMGLRKNSNRFGFEAQNNRYSREEIMRVHDMLDAEMKQMDISKLTGISQPVVSQIKRESKPMYRRAHG